MKRYGNERNLLEAMERTDEGRTAKRINIVGGTRKYRGLSKKHRLYSLETHRKKLKNNITFS